MTDYDAARERLREAELALMQQRESVAALRRGLPPGPTVENYVFGSSDGEVALTDLFSAPDRPLVLYHFMFGGVQGQACPMCSMWADGWNAVQRHLDQNIDVALVTNGTVAENAELASARGWTNLRWLSAADSSFKADFGSQDDAGNQMPFFTLFELDGDTPRLTCSRGAHITGEHWRGVDLLSPVWHFLDMTRQGRGDWMPSLDYSS